MNRHVAPHSRFVFLLLLVCGAASCGTIVNGTREEVIIISTPSDATIMVDSTAPVTGFYRGSLTRGTSHTVDISKEGYQTQHIRTGNSASAWFFGNILSFSVLGIIPDMVSGGAFTITPNPILVRLAPGDGPTVDKLHYLDGYIHAILPIVFMVGIVYAILTYSPGGGYGFSF